MPTPDLSAELHAALLEIYNVRAYSRYGLSKVNQLLHAVQSGALAKSRQLPVTLVVAALLHDVGHMVHGLGEHPAAQGIDDHHESVGAAWLKRYFGPAVVEPVRLHVAAKRYLCTVERGYHAKLSDDAIESLALQGGPMSAEEVSAFEREIFWKEAVALRRIDEIAKDPSGAMPLFATFLGDVAAARRESPAL